MKPADRQSDPMNPVAQSTVQRLLVWCFVLVFAATHGAVGQETDPSGAIGHFRRIQLSDSPDSVAISGNGKTIIVASGRELIAIDVSSGDHLHGWEQTKEITDIALSANGRLIAVATGSPIINVYDRKTGEQSQQISRTDAPDFLRHDGQQRLAFYPAGNKLISAGTKKRIYVSDLETGKWEHIMFVKYATSTPVVSPNQKHVVLIGNQNASELSGHVTMYKIRRGLQPLWTQWHHSEEAVTHAAFSPQASRLATTGAGDGVRVWNVQSGEQLAHVKDDSMARMLGVSFVADGVHLLMASQRELQLRRIDVGGILTSWLIPKDEELRGIACSDDGTVAVTFGRQESIDVWSVQKPQ